MSRRLSARAIPFIVALLVIGNSAIAQTGTVKGSFVLAGKEARLAHVRAKRAVLDDGKKKTPGYAVLLSEKPASGDIDAWRTGEPAERGSFIYLMLEADGNVWIAELGHAARKGGRFGVVTELKKIAFAVKGEQLTAHYGTQGEESFSDDRYTVDLSFDTALESK